MKKHPGQVALYLAFVLVAIAFLVLMDVGAFLGVSAHNTTMNSGDAAALAVSRYQGELINRIGQWNIDHLKAAIMGDAKECEEIAIKQLRTCFIDPLEGIRIGNEAAKENGCDRNDGMQSILLDHANEIRDYYAPNPDVYPEPWEGAWEEYAARLELAVGGGIWAGPDNIDFLDPITGHLLLDRGFYQAIAGRNWCWFHFNASGLLADYTNFREWEPLPGRDEETRRRRCVNSEVYSLGLDVRVGSAVAFLGTNLIARLTGATAEEMREAELLRDQSQLWFFFDTRDLWRKWWEIDPSGEWGFPVMGQMKEEYDLRGCAAVCRTTQQFVTLVDDDEIREAAWSGAAKPFGTVENEKGEVDVVTALKGFVTPAFADARLVPLDTVGGRDLSTADPVWMKHVRKHLDEYMQNGPNRLSPCWYCQQLVTWEKPSFRSIGTRWLKFHSRDCVRPQGSGGGHGGSSHGH